jgi:uncharacterized YigZ family protein
MTKLLIPLKKSVSEINILNSRFITTAIPCFTSESAKTFFKDQKRIYSDASHIVPIYILGHGNSVTMHSSDDGEPSGTAGRPALSVLKGSGIGDVAVTVTRYFGGKKLGTGGLVKAYSESIRKLLSEMELAFKTSLTTIEIETDYKNFDTLKYIIKGLNGKTENEFFTEKIVLQVTFPTDSITEFSEKINKKFSGKIVPKIINTNPNAIFPLQKLGNSL